ncbi:UDP-sugar transporter UST74c-like [Sitodiplosis mosellana]|uniref:UDP-sugar transporter UST74c-like n=1 Tax=Sitodiplosis mosellana TaxID=263140 RepID=UPI0024452F9C|nr:UDP-sugar transporter UST74c-like [Sitodiplosis mosellana]
MEMTRTKSNEMYKLLPTGEDSSSSTDELLTCDKEPQEISELWKKIGSALFYGIASFFLTVVNKTVLTSWHFPSFLVISIGQLAAAIIVLYVGKQMDVITFPDFKSDIPRKMMPLPILHFGNMVTGLGGTKAMPLPMFTAFRRVSILLTMLLEIKILGVQPSLAIRISVCCMVGGALLAAVDDLTFTIEGYSYVMFANFMTAAYGVYIKQKLNTADSINKYGVMFYNSLIMIVPAIVTAWFNGDLNTAFKYKHWTNLWFFAQFFASCFMGFILTYSTFLCTQYNSALTTAMVGCFKNVFVSYLGMFIGGDYIFSWLNCIGINISVIASIHYTCIIIAKKDDVTELSPKSVQQV